MEVVTNRQASFLVRVTTEYSAIVALEVKKTKDIQ